MGWKWAGKDKYYYEVEPIWGAEAGHLWVRGSFRQIQASVAAWQPASSDASTPPSSCDADELSILFSIHLVGMDGQQRIFWTSATS